jgi:hypothetical protein
MQWLKLSSSDAYFIQHLLTLHCGDDYTCNTVDCQCSIKLDARTAALYLAARGTCYTALRLTRLCSKPLAVQFVLIQIYVMSTSSTVPHVVTQPCVASCSSKSGTLTHATRLILLLSIMASVNVPCTVL